MIIVRQYSDRSGIVDVIECQHDRTLELIEKLSNPAAGLLLHVFVETERDGDVARYEFKETL